MIPPVVAPGTRFYVDLKALARKDPGAVPLLKLQGEFLPAPGFDLASAAPYERVFMQPVAREVGVRLPPGPVAPGATVAYGGYTSPSFAGRCR